MKMKEFLNVIGGELVRVIDGGKEVYDADKNAWRANRSDLLDREIYNVRPCGVSRFEIRLKKEE